MGIIGVGMANKGINQSKSPVQIMFETALGNHPIYFNDKSKFSNSFIDFIDQCLQFDPIRRPTCSELLKHPFLRSNFENIDLLLRDRLKQLFFLRALNV